jgi:hypothetical protein
MMMRLNVMNEVGCEVAEEESDEKRVRWREEQHSTAH